MHASTIKQSLCAFPFFVIATHAVAVECNRTAAREIQIMIHEFAQWRVEGDHLVVHWIYNIEKKPEAERLKTIQTYANMDACLFGGAREIHFYRKNKIMGIASPTSGVRLVK